MALLVWSGKQISGVDPNRGVWRKSKTTFSQRKKNLFLFSQIVGNDLELDNSQKSVSARRQKETKACRRTASSQKTTSPELSP